MFPSPSLKFRTAGFPQYGFKRKFRRHLRLPVESQARPAYLRRTNLISGQSPVTQITRPTEGLTVVDRVHPAQAARSPAAQDDSVQRPLAPQRVVVSRRIIAYYGLIRASRSLPPTYAFAGGSSNPGACLGRRTRGSPIYSLFLCLRAVLRTPVDRMAASGCASPSALAFATFVLARHPHGPHTSVLAWVV